MPTHDNDNKAPDQHRLLLDMIERLEGVRAELMTAEAMNHAALHTFEELPTVPSAEAEQRPRPRSNPKAIKAGEQSAGDDTFGRHLNISRLQSYVTAADKTFRELLREYEILLAELRQVAANPPPDFDIALLIPSPPPLPADVDEDDDSDERLLH